MCYRTVMTTPKAALAELFGALPGGLPEQQPRYNIRPTQPLVTVRADQGRRIMREMRWGFVPHWYKTLKDGPIILNARAETIATKPSFAEAVRQRRCLIPSDGYYEWTTDDSGQGKDPWFIHPTDGQCMGFAGIWQAWRQPDGDMLETCAIVTTAANTKLHNLHARMPLIIAPKDFSLWLGEAGHGAARLMVPAPDDSLEYYRVKREVNGAKDEKNSYIQPLEVSLNQRQGGRS